METITIRGRIEKSDFVAAYSSKNARSKSPLIIRLCYHLTIALCFLVALLLHYAKPKHDGHEVLAVAATFLIIMVAGPRISRWHTIKIFKGLDYWNVGDFSATIAGDMVILDGTTFKSTVPIGNIHSMDDNPLAPKLLFGVGLFYLLPRKDAITEGDFDNFMSHLKKLLAIKNSIYGPR